MAKVAKDFIGKVFVHKESPLDHCAVLIVSNNGIAETKLLQIYLWDDEAAYLSGHEVQTVKEMEKTLKDWEPITKTNLCKILHKAIRRRKK